MDGDKTSLERMILLATIIVGAVSALCQLCADLAQMPVADVFYCNQ